MSKIILELWAGIYYSLASNGARTSTLENCMCSTEMQRVFKSKQFLLKLTDEEGNDVCVCVCTVHSIRPLVVFVCWLLDSQRNELYSIFSRIFLSPPLIYFFSLFCVCVQNFAHIQLLYAIYSLIFIFFNAE